MSPEFTWDSIDEDLEIQPCLELFYLHIDDVSLEVETVGIFDDEDLPW